jgi:hypothetical protein
VKTAAMRGRFAVVRRQNPVPQKMPGKRRIEKETAWAPRQYGISAAPVSLHLCSSTFNHYRR